MKFKFLGKPDYKVSFYETGKVYDLDIEVLEKGVFFTKEYPVIANPVYCPYSSWDTFYLNWERVRS